MLSRLLVLVLLCFVALAFGADGTIGNARLERDEGGYVLNADVELELSPRLADAVSRGVSLYFDTEFRIERPRWYWFDQVVVQRNLEYRLYYHAITRSYRLSIGSLHRSFEDLDSAVRTMLRVRHWQVADAEALEPGMPYELALRFRLDTSQLPKPFQVAAISGGDWSLETDWMRWTYTPGAVAK